MKDELRNRLLTLYRIKGDARLPEIGEFNLILHTAETHLAHEFRDLMLSADDVKENQIRRFDVQTGKEIERTPADAFIRAEVFRERISQALRRLDPSILL
jgi:hypothetical protein